MFIISLDLLFNREDFFFLDGFYIETFRERMIDVNLWKANHFFFLFSFIMEFIFQKCQYCHGGTLL